MVAHNSPHPSLVPADAGLVSNIKLLTRQQKFGVPEVLRRPGGQPDGESNDDAKACNPDEQAFSHGAEGSQVSAAGGAVGFNLLEEGDDIALALRGDVGITEDRHVLRTGDHCLVDVLARNIGQGGSELAAGERTAGRSSVVAHGAVSAEEFATGSRVTLFVQQAFLRKS